MSGRCGKRVAVGFGAIAMGGLVALACMRPLLAQADPLGTALKQADPTRLVEVLGTIAADPARARQYVNAAAGHLRHAEPRVRVAAAEAVVAAGQPALRFLPQLLQLMTDEAKVQRGVEDIPVWYLVAQAVGKLGKPVVPKLKAWLGPDDVLKCRAACVAIHEVGPEAREVVPVIARLIERHDKRYLLELLHALMGVGPAAVEALPAVRPLIDDPWFHARYWACKAIGAMGPAAKAAVPDLVRATGRFYPPSVRRHAALALGQIGPVIGKEGAEALLRLLDDPIHPIRADALTALGKIGPVAKEGAADLKTRLVEDRITPGAPALYAYWRMTGDDAFVRPRLLARMRTLNGQIETLPVLAEMGPDARFALDAVIACTQLKDEVVRYLAVVALERMGVFDDRVLAAVRPMAAETERDEDVRATARRILKKATQGR